MKNRWLTLIFFIMAMSMAQVCAEDNDDKSKPAKAPVTAAKPDASKPKDDRKLVQIKKKMLPIVGVVSRAAGPASIIRSFEVPGDIELNLDATVRVSPRLPGRIIQVLKTAGDIVAAGDVLTVVESTELGNAKVDYFTAKNALEFAQADLAREQIIHDNTERLLAALKGDPEPAALEKAAADFPLGDLKSKILSALSSLRLARAAAARAEKLKDDKLVSGATYESAIKDLESARADYRGSIEEVKLNYTQRLVVAKRAVTTADLPLKNADRRLHLLGVTTEQIATLADEKPERIARYEIKAPIAGTILERLTTVGERVEESKEVFVIADLSTVWATLRVYPHHLSDIKQGQNVRISVQGVEQVIDGRIGWINPVADERTRSTTVRVVANNSKGNLRPGLFVTAAVVLDEKPVPLAVPVEAIQTVDGKSVVFVQKPDDGDDDLEYLATPVLAGDADEKWIEIKAGLKAGETIVVRNSFILKAELGKGDAVDND